MVVCCIVALSTGDDDDLLPGILADAGQLWTGLSSWASDDLIVTFTAPDVATNDFLFVAATGRTVHQSERFTCNVAGDVVAGAVRRTQAVAVQKQQQHEWWFVLAGHGWGGRYRLAKKDQCFDTAALAAVLRSNHDLSPRLACVALDTCGGAELSAVAALRGVTSRVWACQGYMPWRGFCSAGLVRWLSVRGGGTLGVDDVLRRVCRAHLLHNLADHAGQAVDCVVLDVDRCAALHDSALTILGSFPDNRCSPIVEDDADGSQTFDLLLSCVKDRDDCCCVVYRMASRAVPRHWHGLSIVLRK